MFIQNGSWEVMGTAGGQGIHIWKLTEKGPLKPMS